ncbi:AT-hook motif nuclear-localized protein 1 [Rhynchospora pubera]|uniref:AT-hook motif nuclear-localized protein n=1 Tax=Rhynchospora pubera TaxID=906938 RepID=A0AAV8GQB8_9POAL|nr:AT-hook motif nuclear-localized protein 1 [Rhynchospora pubera]
MADTDTNSTSAEPTTTTTNNAAPNPTSNNHADVSSASPTPASNHSSDSPVNATTTITTITTTATNNSVPVGPTTTASPISSSLPSLIKKKKRGRPRKYGPDGRPRQPPPLRATPISAAEAVEPYTPAAAVGAAMRRAGSGARPVVGFVSKPSSQQQFGFGSAAPTPVNNTPGVGELVSCAAGANFQPHVISVAPGEDVTMKIISFSQQGHRAICVLSANGVISNVTLRQPDSLGGTLTYEGRFELLSLSGSFMPTENSGTRSRSGGMSVSLASPDGRVVGGGVAGLLVAAGPVQVVVGSWMPGYQIEQKAKKHRPVTPVVVEATPVSAAPTIPFTITSGDADESYVSDHARNSNAPKVTVTSAAAFRVENL